MFKVDLIEFILLCIMGLIFVGYGALVLFAKAEDFIIKKFKRK